MYCKPSPCTYVHTYVEVEAHKERVNNFTHQAPLSGT